MLVFFLIVFWQFSQNIDGFRQNKQNSLEKYFMLSVHQSYTLALKREKRLEYVYSHMQSVWHRRKCVECVEDLIA